MATFATKVADNVSIRSKIRGVGAIGSVWSVLLNGVSRMIRVVDVGALLRALIAMAVEELIHFKKFFFDLREIHFLGGVARGKGFFISRTEIFEWCGIVGCRGNI